MNGKFRDYKRSFPIRVVMACIIVGVLAAVGRLIPEDEGPVAAPPGPETGLDALYKEENEAIVRDMVERQEKK